MRTISKTTKDVLGKTITEEKVINVSFDAVTAYLKMHGDNKTLVTVVIKDAVLTVERTEGRAGKTITELKGTDTARIVKYLMLNYPSVAIRIN
jgi:hypothetical protein